MKTMTIRGLEPILIDKMKEFAKQHNQSLNQFVVETLMLHIAVKNVQYHHFCSAVKTQ